MVLYITYTTSSHYQTVDIITFAQFEEVNLVVNERNVVEDKSILDLIYESYVDDGYYDESISMKALKNIRGGNYLHPYIKARDSRLKIFDCVSQAQSEWKGEETSDKL